MMIQTTYAPTMDFSRFTDPKERFNFNNTSRFSETVVEDFMYGECWRLAWELVQRGCGKLAVVVEVTDPEFWRHTAVEVAEGLYLDVEGFFNEAEMTARFADCMGENEVLVIQNELYDYYIHGVEADELVPDYVVKLTADRIMEWVGFDL